jgi:hypothetical protein
MRSRRGVLRSLSVLVCAALFLIVAGTGPASAQGRFDPSRVRVLAIAPFADDASLSRPVADYGARRLGELLGGRGYQVIPASRVASEMGRLGIGPRELISPTKTWTIGQALGADAVVTGRVVHFFEERDDAGDDGGRSFGFAVTRVDVDIRVLDINSRVNLFQNTFMCTRPWPTYAAMECVVRDVASILGGRP